VRTDLLQHLIARAVMMDGVVRCQADAVAKYHEQNNQLEVRVRADLQEDCRNRA
jgi:hypothetical protein